MFGGKKIRFGDIEEKQIIQACMEQDEDKDGVLTPEEFKKAMGTLGFKDFEEDDTEVFEGFDLGIVRSADGKKRFHRKHIARCTDVGCCL